MIDAKKIIYIASVQHTGVWFVINFLKQHSKIEKFIEYTNLINEKEDAEDGKFTLLQSHIAIDTHGIHKNDKIKHLKPVIINSLIKTYKTIIPVRDPLMSLITRHNRHPELNHEYIVMGFTYIAGLENVSFFPVDIKYNQENEDTDRFNLLNALLAYLGLPTENYVKKYAEDWEPVNTTEDYNYLKDSYKDKNWYAIMKKIPLEFKALSNSKPIIKPFLDKLGYGELAWYDYKY